MKRNSDCIDLLKFILSIFVISIHVELPSVLIYPYSRIAVPIYFVVFSYFSFKKINQYVRKKEKNAVLKNIISRLMKLYSFWFIVLFPITFYIRKYWSFGILGGMLKLLRDFLLGSTFQASWFIMACVLGLLIVYILSEHLSNKALLFITVPIFILTTTISQLNGFDNEIYTRYIKIFFEICGYPYNNFLISLIYIVLGKIIEENKNHNIFKSITCLILVCVGLSVEYYLLNKFDFFIKSCDSYFTLPLLTYYIVQCTLHIKFKIKLSIILRKLSVLFYCLHSTVILFSNFIFEYLNVNDPFHVKLFIITLLFTTLISSLILVLKNKIKMPFLSWCC